MLYTTHVVSPSSPREVFLVFPMPIALCAMKFEKLDPIIELSSDFEGNSTNFILEMPTCLAPVLSKEVDHMKVVSKNSIT